MTGAPEIKVEVDLPDLTAPPQQPGCACRFGVAINQPRGSPITFDRTMAANSPLKRFAIGARRGA
jgi:hypothetical protein